MQLLQWFMSAFLAFLAISCFAPQNAFYVAGKLCLVTALLTNPFIYPRFAGHNPFLSKWFGYLSLSLGLLLLSFGAEVILVSSSAERRVAVKEQLVSALPSTSKTPPPSLKPSTSLTAAAATLTPSPTRVPTATVPSSSRPITPIFTPKPSPSDSPRRMTEETISEIQKRSIYREAIKMTEDETKKHWLVIEKMEPEASLRFTEKMDQDIEKRILKKYSINSDQYMALLVEGARAGW